MYSILVPISSNLASVKTGLSLGHFLSNTGPEVSNLFIRSCTIDSVVGQVFEHFTTNYIQTRQAYSYL